MRTKEKYRMDPQVKKMWVDALRSGDFEQGTMRLRTDTDEYCPYGVLCELAARQGVIPEAEMGLTGYYYGPDYQFPTDAVFNWAFLIKESSSPKFSYWGDIAAVNDGGASFAEIADLIEEEF